MPTPYAFLCGIKIVGTLYARKRKCSKGKQDFVNFKETTNKSIRGHAEGFFRQARKMLRRRSIATSNGI